MSRTPRNETRQGAGRRKRTPLGSVEQKMARKPSPGMVGRWINDVNDRIARALRGDWKHVMESTGIDGEEKKPVSMVVGTKEDGTPMVAYYMEIPREFYEEDQAAKLEQVDRIDDAIRHGTTAGEHGTDGRYVPKQGISVRTRNAP